MQCYRNREKANKDTSHDIHNEIIKIMANSILREMVSSIKCYKHFTIMIDERIDVSNKEHCVLVMRWVDNTIEVHEDFSGLYEINGKESVTLVKVIKDVLVLLRLNLSLTNICGQCYDGVSAIGQKGGVAKCIQDIEPRAVFTHCYDHSLNLAVSESVKACKMMMDVLETVREITKLIKFSPQREGIIRAVKDEIGSDAAGIRVFCPTRWTVKHGSNASIIDNHEELKLIFDRS